MVGGNLRSRSNRRRKKRKNNRNLMMFLALAFLFFTILLSLIVLNKNDDSEAQLEEATEEEQEQEKEPIETEKDTDETKNDTDKEKEPDENKEPEKEPEKENDKLDETEEKSKVSVTEIEPEKIDDSNVLKAYVGDWQPVDTKQSGEHTTNYQNGSDDRIEIKRAVSYATDIPGDDMVEWRVENGGDQKVIATVSDSNEEENFRVYLTWIDNNGWQVAKLEHLKKNDKK